MAYENPYMIKLERLSDDEIFEILSNSDETETPDKYVAAISIALKRELISEYQSMELLDGNTSVLEYNPNNIGKLVEDYYQEEGIRKEDAKRNKIGNTHYGLILVFMGVVLLFLAYSGELHFPIRSKVVGFISIGIGFLLVVVDSFRKLKKKQNDSI